MKVKWLVVVAVLSVTSLAEAQVDCTVDQLNPECVRYVLKHSAGQLPDLGAWPNLRLNHYRLYRWRVLQRYR